MANGSDRFGISIDMSFARFKLSSDQTLNGTSNQTVTWDTSDYNIGSVFSISAGIVTVNSDCSVRLIWSLNTDVSPGNTTARIYVNRSGGGNVSEYANARDWNNAGGFFSQNYNYTLENLSAGDTFYVTQNETNGSTVDILSVSDLTFMEVEVIPSKILP